MNHAVRFPKYFRILGNPNRFNILRVLRYSSEPIHVTELAQRAGVPMSKISDQLMVLRRYDLVSGTPFQTYVNYQIKLDVVGELCKEYLVLARSKQTVPQPIASDIPPAASAELPPFNLQRAFWTLANDTRNDMYLLLLSLELYGIQICERFYLEQPTVSQHLKLLRDAGLIQARKVQMKSYYRSALGPLESAITRFLDGN